MTGVGGTTGLAIGPVPGEKRRGQEQLSCSCRGSRGRGMLGPGGKRAGAARRGNGASGRVGGTLTGKKEKEGEGVGGA